MAYRKLAIALDNSGAARVRIIAAATKAFEHRDRMPELERYITSALYYDAVDYDLTKQVAAYRSALELDPDNLIAGGNLALDLLQLRKWAEAESLALRGTRLGNTWQDAGEAMTAPAAQGHLADAQATCDRYAHTSPQSPWVVIWRAMLATGRGDYAPAEQEIGRLRREQRTSPSWTAWTSFTLAL